MDVVLRLSHIDRIDSEVIDVVTTEKTKSVAIPMETLTVFQDIVDSAMSAIFSTVLNTSLGVGEADVGVEEELILTFRADSVGIGNTFAIFLLALVESVQEVPC